MKAVGGVLGIVAVVTSPALLASQTTGRDPAVLQVITISQNADNQAFLQSYKDLRQVAVALAPAIRHRVLQGDLAGPYVGALSVLIEYPNLEYMAKVTGIWTRDDQYRDLADKLNDSNETIQSNSLLVDITPGDEPGALKECTQRNHSVVQLLTLRSSNSNATKSTSDLAEINELLPPDANVRMWLGFLSGSNTGMISVLMEYCSLEAMVIAMSRWHAEIDWQTFRKELVRLGTTMLSFSLLQDVTPQTDECTSVCENQ